MKLFNPFRVKKKTTELPQDIKSCQALLIDLKKTIQHQAVELSQLRRMASLPEQNPDIVIEGNPGGSLTYINPIGTSRFPDLARLEFNHPLLHGISGMVDEFETSTEGYIRREIDTGGAVFEQKICYLPESTLVRVFSHDITARKRAEEEVSDLANQLRKMTQKIVLTQEEERRRISRELHDEAGQALIALKISLEILRDELIETGTTRVKNLEDALALTDSTRNQIRMLAQDLRPPILDTLGLNLALDDFCSSFGERTHLEISYQGAILPDLPDAITVSLYRFLQEALSNVAEHARASTVKVRLDLTDHVICLIVRDNGVGISENTLETLVHDAQGMGIRGMRERLEMLGGWLEIESSLGGGTRLEANLPTRGHLD